MPVDYQIAVTFFSSDFSIMVIISVSMLAQRQFERPALVISSRHEANCRDDVLNWPNAVIFTPFAGITFSRRSTIRNFLGCN